jgi:hypothetical protein
MHKTLQLIIGIILVTVVTLGMMVYSGTQTGRWSQFSGLIDAQKAVKELPKEIGDWEAEGEDQLLDSETIAMLQIQDGYLVRAYRNTKTQAVIYMVLMVGPTGRVVVHTPEICFGGKDYQKEDTRSSVTVPVTTTDDSGEWEDSFWRVDFIKQGLRYVRISFYYSVCTGQQWTATENPRYTFRSYRYAYKIQIQSVTEGDSDNVKKFLEDCLPTIHEFLKPCN